jgi:hypothetical protein
MFTASLVLVPSTIKRPVRTMGCLDMVFGRKPTLLPGGKRHFLLAYPVAAMVRQRLLRRAVMVAAHSRPSPVPTVLVVRFRLRLRV